jgi:hypothetical protein
LLCCSASDAQETSLEDGAVWIELGKVAPVVRDDDFSVSRDNLLSVAAPGVLANDTDVAGGPLTSRLVNGPSHGALTLGADWSFHYSPDAGFAGTDTFTYSVDGDTQSSTTATARIEVGQQALLLADTFSRPNSATLGNGWTKTEAAGAAVGLDAGRMTFLETSDAVARPMAWHGFPAVTTGTLTWEFELDWTAGLTGNDYAVYMQLGDDAQMGADAPDAGVGVNLVWGRIGTEDQMLGYRRAGSAAALLPMSGFTLVRVQVDLYRFTYDVYVDGALAGTAIPFDAPVALNTVRFIADVLDQHDFSGRAFDSVTISGSAPVARNVFVRAADALEKTITLPYTAGDGPGPYTFDVVAAPRHGTLDDDGDATVIYTANSGFIGEDSFTFRVSDGAAQSSVATVSLAVQHYPGAAWETRTPAEMGMDGAGLDQLAASIGGVGSVVRNGYLVKTWGDQAAKADWASAAKPVLNMLLFFAVQEGRIESVEDRVAPWVLAATGGVLRAEDEEMTFAQLLNMTSGYARIEAPGAAWAYNDVAVQLKNRLIGAIFGEPLDLPLRARLVPLELQDGSLLAGRGGYGVSTTTRDFARIAWFWLNRGHWRGQQILDEHFFENYLRSQVPAFVPGSTGLDADYLNVGTFGGPTDQTHYGPGQFGMNWWFNGPNDAVGTTDLRPWQDAPPDTVLALGHWNREVAVFIPSLNVVVATRGNWGTFVPGDASSGMNERLRLLTQSVIANGSSQSSSDAR